MRLGYDLASEKLCEVPPHTNVEVLEVRQGDGANGRMRARLRFLLKQGLAGSLKDTRKGGSRLC